MGKYAIFIVSALIFSLLTYSSALRNALFMSNTRTVESHGVNQAYNIAQSATMIVTKDIFEKGEDSSFHPEEDSTNSYPSSTGFQDWENMRGSYNVVTRNQGDTLITIQATGRFEESRYIVGAGVLKIGGNTWMPPFDKAIHAENSIDIANGTIHGSISINNNMSSLTTGAQGNITENFEMYDPNIPEGGLGEDEGHEDVGGYTSNMSEKIVYPDPIFPPFPSNTIPDDPPSDSYIHANQINGNYFSNFSTNNTTIDLGFYDEVILHVNDIDLSGGLNIIGDGTLKIYAETGLNLGNGDINENRSSKHLGIYYKGSNDISYNGSGSFSGLLFAGNNQTNITIGGNPTFNGHIISFGEEITLNGTPAASSLIYAPNASVTLKGTGKPGDDFRGSIISESFTANGKASVYYNDDFEDNLPPLEGGNEPIYFVSYWK